MNRWAVNLWLSFLAFWTATPGLDRSMSSQLAVLLSLPSLPVMGFWAFTVGNTPPLDSWDPVPAPPTVAVPTLYGAILLGVSFLFAPLSALGLLYCGWGMARGGWRDVLIALPCLLLNFAACVVHFLCWMFYVAPYC